RTGSRSGNGGRFSKAVPPTAASEILWRTPARSPIIASQSSTQGPPWEEMPMDAPGSVTFWITQLKAGNQAAAQPLWENYFQQLVARTRRLLAGALRRSADEEDVALSAFDSFCRAAAAGRFPRLNDRDDLWQLLVVLSNRKARNLMKYER